MSTATLRKVKISPFVDKGSFNLGLERHDQVVFDGTTHRLEMACVQEGNAIRYLNGLNPFAPDIRRLPKEEQEAKIQEIKSVLIEAEKALGGEHIELKDKDWWNKIVRLRPDNREFWSSSQMHLELGNEPTILKPSENTLDLLKYYAIKAGGYPEIATNLQDALIRPRAPKFFLDEKEETVGMSVEVKMLRNKAGALLDDLTNTNINKLMYICKVIDPNSEAYNKSTPTQVMYDNMDEYIEGKTVDKDKRRTAQHFIEIANLDMETLKLRALVKDCSNYRFIALKNDGMIYDMDSGTAMGKNPTQVVEFLKNPLNEEILERLLNKVEYFWKQ